MSSVPLTWAMDVKFRWHTCRFLWNMYIPVMWFEKLKTYCIICDQRIFFNDKSKSLQLWILQLFRIFWQSLQILWQNLQFFLTKFTNWHGSNGTRSDFPSSGSYTTHNLVCRMALTSYDQIPDDLHTICQYAYVEFTMPATQVSHTTVRSVSISNSDSDVPPEKYVRHLARHEYR